MRARWMILGVALFGLLGCSSDTSAAREIGAADAYLAIVNWELEQIGQSGPPGTDASLPVVYVAAEDGTSIDAGAQAKVVQSTVDTAKVRFTDGRDDAIDKNVDGEPVKDAGVMLIVPKIDGKGKAKIELPVTVYRDAADQQKTTLTLVATTAGALVTSASPVPPASSG